MKKISIVHHMRSSEDHPIWLLKLYRRVECHYLRSVDGFIFNSQSTRQSVEALINSRPPALVAPPSGAEFQLSISADEILARARQSGPLKLLFVGNIIPRKGLHILLDALQRTPDGAAALTVVGNPAIDRGYTNALLRQVKRSGLQERVSFAGQLSRDELAGQLRAHHVLAVPSTYEGFGIVYLEGMGFGLPAIGTTSGGAAEIITDSTDGFLVAPGDSEALGRLLVSLHQDRSRLARMSLAARQRYRSHPGWEVTCAAIHAFLRCQINPQPGTGQRREMQAAPVTFPCGGAS